MNIFLRQEVDRMQAVIGLVRTTLTDLKLAIDGTIVMSQGLRASLDAMYDARIPDDWSKVGVIYTGSVNGTKKTENMPVLFSVASEPVSFWRSYFGRQADLRP